MKLWEAMKLVHEGKKVRQINWEKEQFVYMKDDELVNYNGLMFGLRIDGCFINDEWEEYIEPKLVELPPYPKDFDSFACISICHGCNINLLQWQKARDWIRALYKDKK